MYFNDVHILLYVLFGTIAAILGQFIDYSSKAFVKENRIFSKETFKEYAKTIIPNYTLIFIMVMSYIALIYKFGIYTDIDKNINLIKYMLVIPLLLCAFYVDFKEQIIPNRLNLLMFEIGIVFVVLNGFSNINIAIDMLYGMIVGGGIFIGITLLGGFIAGKEAMGLGDVKLMGALGLFFGLNTIVAVSVMSFLMGAVVSVALMISKVKKSNEYIPFGPFIVLSAIIAIFIPFEIIFNFLMTIFTLGMYTG